MHQLLHTDVLSDENSNFFKKWSQFSWEYYVSASLFIIDLKFTHQTKYVLSFLTMLIAPILSGVPFIKSLIKGMFRQLSVKCY